MTLFRRNGRQTLFPGVDGKTKQPRMQDKRGSVCVSGLASAAVIRNRRSA